MERMVKLDKGLVLGFDAKRIGNKIKEYAKKARNEEELKIKVEGLIQEIIRSFLSPGRSRKWLTNIEQRFRGEERMHSTERLS